MVRVERDEMCVMGCVIFVYCIIGRSGSVFTAGVSCVRVDSVGSMSFRAELVFVHVMIFVPRYVSRDLKATPGQQQLLGESIPLLCL